MNRRGFLLGALLLGTVGLLPRHLLAQDPQPQTPNPQTPANPVPLAKDVAGVVKAVDAAVKQADAAARAVDAVPAKVGEDLAKVDGDHAKAGAAPAKVEEARARADRAEAASRRVTRQLRRSRNLHSSEGIPLRTSLHSGGVDRFQEFGHADGRRTEFGDGNSSGFICQSGGLRNRRSRCQRQRQRRDDRVAGAGHVSHLPRRRREVRFNPFREQPHALIPAGHQDTLALRAFAKQPRRPARVVLAVYAHVRGDLCFVVVRGDDRSA